MCKLVIYDNDPHRVCLYMTTEVCRVCMGPAVLTELLGRVCSSGARWPDFLVSCSWQCCVADLTCSQC